MIEYTGGRAHGKGALVERSLWRNRSQGATGKSNIIVLNTPFATLLFLSALGDVAAFTRLYDATSPRIYTLVLRQVGAMRAEAVTEQVFVTLWRTAGDYAASRGNALAWMVSVAAHVAGSHGAPTRFDLHQAHPPDLCPLTMGQQDILTLVYLGGLTVDQVADLLQVSQVVVARTVRDGLGRIRSSFPAAS